MLPELVPGCPVPPVHLCWGIKELNMLLCVWFEYATDGIFIQTCFAYPNESGILCVCSFWNSYKGTPGSLDEHDSVQTLILKKSVSGAFLAMELIIKDYEDTDTDTHTLKRKKVQFYFKRYCSNGSVIHLDITSSPNGVHFISNSMKENREVEDEELDDEELDDEELEDEKLEDEKLEDEELEDEELKDEKLEDEDSEEEDEDSGEEDEELEDEKDEELEDKKDEDDGTSCRRHNLCPPLYSDKNKSSVPPPPPPPPPPDHINGRWRTKKPTSVTGVIWTEKDNKNLWSELLCLRQEMSLKCNGSFDEPCPHLIWRYFAQNALKGTQEFLPKETKCCMHGGSQLFPISQHVNEWLVQHKHESYDEFIKSTRSFFEQKGMLEV